MSQIVHPADTDEILRGYQEMAADKEREAEAFEWCETFIGECLEAEPAFAASPVSSSFPRSKPVPNKYGQAAVLAATKVLSSKLSPQDAWSESTFALFPGQPDSQKKGCPKGAFLGLCEDGWIQGISSGSYTTSKDNKYYAIRALSYLENGHPANKPLLLWKAVMNGTTKAHNGQMDVVLALWNGGFIKS